MNLTITDAASSFYINEIPLKEGDTLRLFVRVGGIGSGGFSVGVIKELHQKTSYIVTKQGVDFFVNEDDFWYIDGMTIHFDEDMDYLEFISPKFEQIDHPDFEDE
ncbi:iron-sulfur cluster biosynthesis family protein [Alkalihalophilus lindianensis]|uniref:Iron-sulfur cluster biosynthesis family protein n=1 Tax=Alkalihalophilus lindianensis TaxID=1630542 RepID=A0ABU3X6R1_9BACI|nr:iron-sulfur cluster biosynthesis family protein [Alkalihalophilus lindianensis]MDV2683581.1 iron-sulfur cluster biosynthesis family protein [Alkalihalophilus lindianensis]